MNANHYEAKESLAERLVAYLEATVDPGVARSHIEVVKRRRDEARSGKASLVEGELTLARARRMVRE